MKKVVWSLLALAVTAAPAAAQNPISDSLRSSWNNIKRNIAQSAELMPEENFNFKPTPDVRSFGEILAHVAGASFESCGAAHDEKAPFQEASFEKTATTKAEIVKVTNDAIAYCDQAFAAVTDATAGLMVHGAFGSANETKRMNMLLGQIGHDNEHYGNLVTYFRLKGLVPPSSRPR